MGFFSPQSENVIFALLNFSNRYSVFEKWRYTLVTHAAVFQQPARARKRPE
jgi:hypothetical protein